MTFSESVVRGVAWVKIAGWQIAHGQDIAPHMPAVERSDAGDDAMADAHLPEPQENRQ